MCFEKLGFRVGFFSAFDQLLDFRSFSFQYGYRIQDQEIGQGGKEKGLGVQRMALAGGRVLRCT